MSQHIVRICITALVALSLSACGGGGGGGGGGTPPPPPTSADIDVDTDRDGTVENTTEDETGEDAWTTSAGAVFYYNTDDDDNPLTGVEDWNDTTVNGTNDAKDLSRVWIRKTAVPSGGTATVLVTPSAAQSGVRLFRNNGGWSQVYAGGASFTLPAADVGAADIELGIEARGRYSPSWNGTATLTFEIRDSSAALVSSDVVLLKCAPQLLSDNLWTAEKLCVVEITSSLYAPNTPFVSTLSTVCAAAGVTLQKAAGSSYGYDRWIQDSHETGVIYLPDATSGRRRVDSVLQLARSRAVDDWCEDVLFNPNFDFVRRFSTNTSSMNYGGNLEIIPPHTVGPTNHAWGRILIGGGSSTPVGGGATVTRYMVQAYRDYFNALSYQGGYLQISTEWLAVGHVDEYLQVVPAPATARGWKIALSSPDLAKSLLSGIADTTKKVFAGRTSGGWETTVGAILGDATLMAYNDDVQSRIDTAKAYLKTNCGLTDADFVELPTLYEDVGGGVAAYNPGVVNLVTIGSASGTWYLVVPDPEGPDDPTDVWADATKTALESLGTAGNPVVVTFTDVFYSYHDLLGEAHCGTNAVRTPPATNWWDK